MPKSPTNNHEVAYMRLPSLPAVVLTALALLAGKSTCAPAQALPSKGLFRARMVIQGIDVMATPREEVELVASLARYSGPGHHRPVAGRKVYFLIGDKRIGLAKTSDRGYAVIRYRTEDPGDLVIRLSTSRRSGNSRTQGRLFVRVQDRRFPVLLVDVEKTLHDLSSIRFPFTPNEGVSAAPGSVAALKALSRYRSVVYISSGGGSSAWKLREWLGLRGFPAGPILHWPLPGEPARAAQRKAELTRELKNTFANIIGAVANRAADAVACHQSEIACFLVAGRAPESLPKGTRHCKTWRELADLMAIRR